MILKWITLLGLFFVAAFLPLAKGGNTNWAHLVPVTIIPVLFFLNCISISVTRPTRLRQGIIKENNCWIAVWAVVTGWVGFQLFPGLGNRFGMDVALICSAEGICENQSISVFPMATVSSWALFTAYWMAAWMVSQLNRSHIVVLLLLISILALFEALYGMIALVNQTPHILGIWEKTHYLNDAAGTFINRNHFAGYLELVWPAMMSLLFLHYKFGGFNLQTFTRVALAGVLSLILLMGILNSHSRLGTLAALGGFICWALLMRRAQSAQHRKKSFLVGWAIAGVVLLGCVWFGLEPLIERFSRINDSEGRIIVWSALTTLPLSTWLTGIGLGSFIDVFRTVQPSELKLLYEYAHSDVLEFLLDFGIVGSALVLFSVIIWFRGLWPAQLGVLQIGAFSGIMAILVHSLADFNLHISGVAMTFWIMIGVLVNANLDLAKERVSNKERR